MNETSIFLQTGCNIKIHQGNYDGQKEAYQVWKYKRKVPQYKGFTVKNILEFAQKNIHIDTFLPDYDYLKETNREWLWNMVDTIIPEKSQNFVQAKVEKRREQLIDTQNLWISVQPEYIHIFKASQSISTVKRKSHYLTRLPKPTKNILKFKN